MSLQGFSVKLSRQILIAAGTIYAIILAIASWKHVFWRDETQAWLLARDSHSPLSLVHNVRYEGTPPLWHFVLYFISHFTLNPGWMKIPNYIFSVAAAALIFSATKLPLWVRFGFVFSYFILFEYAVIDRDYMIGVLLLLATLTLFKNDRSDFRISIALSLAALTSLPALVVAVCLYPVHLAPVISQWDISKPGRWLRALSPKKTLTLIFFSACVLASLAIIRPPDGASTFLGHGQWVKLLRVMKFSNFTEAYLPAPDSFYFWNSSFFSLLGRFASTIVGFVLAVTLCFWLRCKQAKYFFIITSSLLMGEMAVTKMFAMRHVGWLFIVFLLSVIIQSEDDFRHTSPETSQTSAWRSAFLAGILIVQVGTGIFAIILSLRHPFSPSKQLTIFLQQQHLDHSPIVFLPDYIGGAVLAYLQRPTAYSTERRTQSSFMIWDKVEMRPHELPTKQELFLAAENGTNPVLITEGPLTNRQMSDLGMKFVAKFDGALNASDHYFVYK